MRDCRTSSTRCCISMPRALSSRWNGDRDGNAGKSRKHFPPACESLPTGQPGLFMKTRRGLDHLKKKVVVLTGASSGFGKGAARSFAKAGARLVLAARRERLLNELADECNATGGYAVAIPTDVSKIRDVQALAQKTVNEFGRIDIWVNDAGVGAVGLFEQVPLADHIQVIETNLLGTVYGSYF